MAQAYGTDADLLEAWPGLSVVPVDRREYWLEYAKCFVHPDQWGFCASFAHVHAAAHIIFQTESTAEDVDGNDGGPIKSSAVGPASETLGLEDAPARGMAWNWSRTAPGREFLRLRAARGPLPFLVRRRTGAIGVVRR